MLPSAHIEFTWGALNLVQRCTGKGEDVDYRLIALAAGLPDLVDKPMAVFVFPTWNAGLLFTHTLLLHLLVWLAVLWRGKRWIPYALAFSGHLVLDRIWEFPRNLWYPLKGWRFHEWRHLGSPKAFVQAYRDLLREYPHMIVAELLGLGVLVWFMGDRKLFNRADLLRFLRGGRV